MDKNINIWDDFCKRMKIYESGVPLFKHSKVLVVKTKTIGKKLKRPVVCRSLEMEKLVLLEADKLVEDWENKKDELDGLIYMMFLKDSGKVLPLYIGKAETIGKVKRNLSANIKNLQQALSF